MIKTMNTLVKEATASASVLLFVTGFGKIVVPISTRIACGILLYKKKFYEKNLNKSNKCTKELEENSTNH